MVNHQICQKIAKTDFLNITSKKRKINFLEKTWKKVNVIMTSTDGESPSMPKPSQSRFFEYYIEKEKN